MISDLEIGLGGGVVSPAAEFGSGTLVADPNAPDDGGVECQVPERATARSVFASHLEGLLAANGQGEADRAESLR